MISLDNIDAAEKNLSEVMAEERITIPMGPRTGGRRKKSNNFAS